MSTRQNVDLYSVPITCKPVYWEIVHNALCLWFWFCLALVCLYAILITGLDLTLTINYPPALWFCAVQILITWLLTFAWINVTILPDPGLYLVPCTGHYNLSPSTIYVSPLGYFRVFCSFQHNSSFSQKFPLLPFLHNHYLFLTM